MLVSHRLPTKRHSFCSLRSFTLLSTHATFPATMYRFQLDRKATLYDVNRSESRYRKDGIKMSEDGLVHAMISKSAPCESVCRFPAVTSSAMFYKILNLHQTPTDRSSCLILVSCGKCLNLTYRFTTRVWMMESPWWNPSSFVSSEVWLYILIVQNEERLIS